MKTQIFNTAGQGNNAIKQTYPDLLTPQHGIFNFKPDCNVISNTEDKSC